jgi:hypothetical protein
LGPRAMPSRTTRSASGRCEWSSSPDCAAFGARGSGVQQTGAASAVTAAAVQGPLRGRPRRTDQARPSSTQLLKKCRAWSHRRRRVLPARMPARCRATAETSSSLSNDSRRLGTSAGTWWRSRDAADRSHNPEVAGSNPAPGYQGKRPLRDHLRGRFRLTHDVDAGACRRRHLTRGGLLALIAKSAPRHEHRRPEIGLDPADRQQMPLEGLQLWRGQLLQGDLTEDRDYVRPHGERSGCDERRC